MRRLSRRRWTNKPRAFLPKCVKDSERGLFLSLVGLWPPWMRTLAATKTMLSLMQPRPIPLQRVHKTNCQVKLQRLLQRPESRPVICLGFSVDGLSIALVSTRPLQMLRTGSICGTVDSKYYEPFPGIFLHAQ